MKTPTLTKPSLISYPANTIKRGERALRCSPFQLRLFTTMINSSVDLKDITLERGLEKKYTLKSITENRVENELMWLIKVGILRREVDGQGITDSFRLTPLGRMIIGNWEKDFGNIPSPTWKDYLFNFLSYYLNWK
ncbi:Npun_F0494 family protein [Geminocystis sp. CENA526]|uniref:Npun_F0494 family protein n=1 Tax=Geminocystis sp. CENA526 TaxID=1355871 RepID=UPI003D6E9469